MNLMSPPLVSVVIPCFNLGAYLDEAIQSVLAQTVQDFEIHVVDDGSTDEATRSLLASADWRRTTVYRTENRGLARARNLLIERSRGEYLCALDADDKLHPQHFEKTLAKFDQEPRLTFVSTRLQMFGEDDRIWPPDLRCDLPMLLCDCPVYSAALVRRAAVVAIGGYDENMPAQGDEDWDLWISLLEAGHTGVILPDILFYYRRRAGSMCDLCTRGQRHLDLVDYLTRKHRDSYRTHLLDVLLWKEKRIADERCANASLESDLAGSLMPTLERRQAELRDLRRLLERLRLPQGERSSAGPVSGAARSTERSREIEDLRVEYQRSVSEVAALRASVSWKITGPLRAAYDLFRRGRTRDSR